MPHAGLRIAAFWWDSAPSLWGARTGGRCVDAPSPCQGITDPCGVVLWLWGRGHP